MGSDLVDLEPWLHGLTPELQLLGPVEPQAREMSIQQRSLKLVLYSCSVLVQVVIRAHSSSKQPFAAILDCLIILIWSADITAGLTIVFCVDRSYSMVLDY